MSPFELPDGTTAAPPSSDGTQTTSTLGGGELGSGSTKDGELSADGRFRWSAGWRSWIPAGKEIVEYLNPWDLSPNHILDPSAMTPIRHGRFCTCDSCLNAGQRRLDWNRNRQNEW